MSKRMDKNIKINMGYKNIEDQRRAQRDFYRKNKDKVLASHKIWVENNKERSRQIIKDWAKKNPDKVRSNRLKYKYGINLEQYNTILTSQNMGCAICGSLENRSKHNKGWSHLCVDHDHITGKVRGLLCDDCNLCIGLIRENSILLKKMILYLKK